MGWRRAILKSNCFECGRERLKGVLLSILIIVSICILSLDVYGSIEDYSGMFILEVSAIVLLLIVYLLFPYAVSLNMATYIVLALITLLIILSLTIPGYNQEFVLFSLAIVPAYLFFFLGIKLSIKWSIVVFFLLLITTLNAHYAWVTPVFNADLLVQVTIAYIALSYLHYSIEKERSGYEKELSLSIKSKDVLLKEVHHRAKNNLQTIMGLLESQAFRTEDKACKKTLTSQRYRLQSMSLVHESLSNDTSYETVNMAQYLTQIVNNIQKSTVHTISFSFDSFVLSMSDAMNLGLFLNEAISNAIEHAYDAGEKGNIEVLLRLEESHYTLRVKDYGKGFDASKRYNSLGLVLMEDISQFSSDGQMMIVFEKGTEVIATFPLSIEE